MTAVDAAASHGAVLMVHAIGNQELLTRRYACYTQRTWCRSRCMLRLFLRTRGRFCSRLALPRAAPSAGSQCLAARVQQHGFSSRSPVLYNGSERSPQDTQTSVTRHCYQQFADESRYGRRSQVQVSIVTAIRCDKHLQVRQLVGL